MVTAMTTARGRLATAPATVPATATVAALAFALVADRVLGEPPETAHPVAWFGKAMTWGEARWWRDSRVAGVAYCFCGVALASLGAEVVERVTGVATGRTRPAPAAALAVAAYVAVASRSLCEAASAVAGHLDAGDLEEARRSLRSLVGRRTDDLDSHEIARAVVESVAENTVDAVIAPVMWGLAGGARGVFVYRAVNTMDAMVGHRSERFERFGWASARLDDVANWLPARVTAALAAICAPANTGHIIDAVRHQAPSHPSPNAGVAEAAFAASLDVRLGGLNDYHGRLENRPQLGHGRPPASVDIEAACVLSRRISLAAVLVMGIAALAADWAKGATR